MSRPKSKELTHDEIIARLEKPKSMRYIRKLMKPLFEELQARFGNAIAEIVEREHWGPNFDAYYDVWVRRRSSEIEKFIDNKLLELENENYVFILVQVKEIEDYSTNSRAQARVNSNSKKRSTNGKLAAQRT
ncbi:hypothetical protein L0337_00490 [candidate division KSB1 bacterium]|nr:hypothetical protein [candidate division KSB1 bacterium]